MTGKLALDSLDTGSPARALRQILAAVNAETGTIHRVGPDGLLHLEQHAGGIPETLLPVIRAIPVGKGMAGLAAERAEPVQVCNLQTDHSGAARPAAKTTGMGGSICVPMMSGGELVGVLGVAVRRAREFDTAEASWLMAAGARLAAGE